MSSNDNRRPRVASRRGGKDYDNGDTANVVKFPATRNNASPFDALTSTLVLDQYRRGVLPEAVLIAFMQAAGVPV